MNCVQLLGRLCAEPELRYTQGNDSVAIVRFNLAVPRRFKTDVSEVLPTAKPAAKGQRPDFFRVPTDFISCICFGKTAEFVSKYFSKGNKIAVTGRIQVDKYKDKSGNDRTAVRVIVETADFCESKAAGNDNRSKTSEDFSEYDYPLPF